MNSKRLPPFYSLALLLSVPPLPVFSQAELGYTPGDVQYRDSFGKDLSNWAVEQQPGGTVQINAGKLEIDDDQGCTVWFRHKMNAPVIIEYEVKMIKAGGPNDNTRDLNCFWMALDRQYPTDILKNRERGGSFKNYDYLRLGG